ncbi:MAG: response regulator transcription factor [Candidatus Woesearchaeota archaeon]
MSKKQKKILVVDDEPHIVNLIKLSLQDSFQIYEAFSGSEALAIAQKVQPDLVILDLMMPNMNGFEVCSKLRTMVETKDTPVLILSAKSQIVDKFKSINSGADDYMVKPFDPQELVKRIELNLGRT